MKKKVWKRARVAESTESNRKAVLKVGYVSEIPFVDLNSHGDVHHEIGRLPYCVRMRVELWESFKRSHSFIASSAYHEGWKCTGSRMSSLVI